MRTWVRSSVVSRGLRGNSTFWLAVGALGLLRRFFEKRGRKVARIRLHERLRPGDELIISYPGRPGRVTRKEVAEVQRRRAAQAEARDRLLSRLQEKVGRGGFGARRAARQLEALIPTRR